jgi:aminoglycoside 2''-phosphotransferase
MHTLNTYIQSIRAAYPTLTLRSARLHTTDGQFNNIVIVNDNLIFRFPRSEHIAASYVTHSALLNTLATQLPLPIPVPSYSSNEDTEWQQSFIGYQLIPGEPLYRMALDTIQNPADRRGMAAQLAIFLRALHHIPVADLPASLPVHESPADWMSLYQGIQKLLFPFMRIDARHSVQAHFEAFLAQPDTMRYTPALRHGDFGGSNILYDPVSRRISGIIDFDSTGLGDPATDVAALLSYGEDFFALCLEHYPEMHAMLERAAFYRGTFALQEAYYGLRDGNQEAFEDGIAQYR